MKLLNTNICLPVLLMTTIISAPSYAVVDDDAMVVYLRKDCTENSVERPNCLTTSGSLVNWLSTSSTKNKVTVEIGAGKFGYLSVPSVLASKKISLNGSGPNVTSFDGMQFTASNLHVQDMTVNSWFPAPVYWHGSGKSTWVNVHLDGGLYGWTETCDGVTKATRPVHYWFSSKITATAKTAYQAGCSENWFFGTELSNSGVLSGISSVLLVGSYNGQDETRPEVHVYGSVLRNIMSEGATHTPMAASAGRNAEIHIHGTGIDVIGNDLANDVIAFNVDNGGFIHATQSAFVLKTAAGGKSIRIQNNGGTVKAPYQWESLLGSAPTIDLHTENGADSTVELVCSDVSCTSKFPHLMIYTDECGTSNPWFDTATGACRL